MSRSKTVVHKIAPLLVGTLLLLGLGSCCPEDPYADYLNLIITTEPKSLDPALSADITTGVITALMYDNLVRFGTGSEILPGLAKSWQISDDGLSYVFHLRDDVTFWNGIPLSAADVKHSFERVLNPETRSPQTWLLSPIKGARAYMQGNADDISGIRTVNNTTVQIVLSSPFAPFLGFLGAPATAIVQKTPRDSIALDLKINPMGTGPWVFQEWQADRQIRYKRYDNYYAGPAKLKGLLLNNIPEVLTSAIEFEAGNLDVMAVPNSEFKYWTRSEMWKPYIHKLDELGIYYLAMNVERKPFDDKRVRQAVTLAIDREKIIYRIMHNSATLAQGPIPPGLEGYDSTRIDIPYDPQAANDLLIEAGYPDGCEFDLWVDPGAAISQTLEAIQHYLNEAGFIVHLVRNDWNMMRDAMRKGQTDAYWGNWWADYADSENFLAPLFHSDNAARRNRYSNPEVDRSIEKQQRSLDADERKVLAMEIDSILIEEAPYAFMWYPTSYTVVQPNLKGYIPHLMPNANKYTDVYFEEQDTP
ncbi:MAG: ABC transporter substrate-binding protein [Candidatus Marinimicrobia bacterium]|jgi:ABC-type transport system substrate-binding protein|nr:ABC transporter substrate-binding protein [Candidatus Neomarinimicrobiota bacterium]MBT3631116.1 ABC transporter substrate-binding protein [Candidatus Neomarinimicrobiota bacterium]MBT3825756.1 ABC transporter substrate-binding protein [Candidatus Neomarinimicrobiota bacterium]MBT4130500.1 ABC transporter substrate-binding protein [Candidatus Neomarinimicrobiota bacterium]MBT4297077.1 ABC transporter substrate-binding protein [Candidatus Neomarinimicrobiota bacterium]